MGNNSSITKILDKHKKLTEKIIPIQKVDYYPRISNDNYPDIDLLFFNIPISFEYARQYKTYTEQMTQASDKELSNTNYNELFLHKYKIIITHDDIILNISERFNRYIEFDINEDNIIIFKHFDFLEDDNDKEPYELEESLNKITNYENEIKLLEIKIKQEKKKILNLDYIKSKLKQQVPKKKEYIETLNYISKKHLNG